MFIDLKRETGGAKCCSEGNSESHFVSFETSNVFTCISHRAIGVCRLRLMLGIISSVHASFNALSGARCLKTVVTPANPPFLSGKDTHYWKRTFKAHRIVCGFPEGGKMGDVKGWLVSPTQATVPRFMLSHHSCSTQPQFLLSLNCRDCQADDLTSLIGIYIKYSFPTLSL